MRLSVLFLLVLGLSAIITSMAAWGITYGTSYSRVSSMASQFTTLAQGSFQQFGSFVNGLLQGNAALVDGILAAQEQSGSNRTEQTKAQMVRTIGILVNYTTNSTDQTQQQMDEVMDTFGALMGTVVADFKGLSSNYVAQLRSDLAAKGTTAISTSSTNEANAKLRFQKLVNLGLLDLARPNTDPIGVQDCTLLGVICDTADEFSPIPFTLISATGRFYTCSTDGAGVSKITYSGGFYNWSRLKWSSYASSVPTSQRLSYKQRCLSESPVETVVGLNCPQPLSCRCGADQRCTAWYQPYVNTSAAYFLSNVYPDASGNPRLHTTLSLLNASASPPAFLGVADTSATLAQTQSLLPALTGLSNQTALALLLNDTNLTMLGVVARKCAANETPPGDPGLPVFSSLRACDAGLRAVAQWLAANRSVPQPVTLEISGILWDVSMVKTIATTYFFIVGTNKSEAYRGIDVSEAMAATQLAATRAELTRKVAASGAATRAYVAAIGAQNIQATQAMQDSFLAEIWALESSSRAALAASQDRSAANAQLMTDTQATAVEGQKNAALDAMGVTAGWTIAVVCGILLAVLLASAFGTIRVTNNLTYIIGLMEDVAEMRVENLVIPRSSTVQEVARIQTAFQVMVQRLAEYKSYIPAGVFERMSQQGKDDAAEDGHVSDQPSHTSDREGGRQGSSQVSHGGCRTPTHAMGGHARKPSAGVTALPAANRRSATKQVAVLAVNVVGFMDLLLASNEALSKAVFNDYVTQVHEVVSQGRGNVDFLVGDQVFVTFNAHVPCADPSGAAAAVALDLQQHLLRKLGDRLKFRIGVSFGPVFASTVGYAKFKFMATVGSPMKLAAILSRLERFESGAALVDANLQERMKYSYTFRPVELLHVPRLKSLVRETPTSQRVFLLVNKKKLQEDEWLYQVDEGAASDWDKTFDQLVAAPSPPELEGLLGQYLEAHPQDELALRLRDRLPRWVPGCGIPA